MFWLFMSSAKYIFSQYTIVNSLRIDWNDFFENHLGNLLCYSKLNTEVIDSKFLTFTVFLLLAFGFIKTTFTQMQIG